MTPQQFDSEDARDEYIDHLMLDVRRGRDAERELEDIMLQRPQAPGGPCAKQPQPSSDACGKQPQAPSGGPCGIILAARVVELRRDVSEVSPVLMCPHCDRAFCGAGSNAVEAVREALAEHLAEIHQEVSP